MPDILSLNSPCSLIENRRASLVCHFAEPRDDARRDWARFSVSEGAAIGFNHGYDFGSSSREEAFVGHENVMPRQICLGDINVELAANLKHDRSRDSL
jgi:hypothetical protein